ncbi:MAG: carboxypeptidase regulatory-like domain-containing protein, partial [Salinibacterium sp.]|nr:carboxypeptidase regulatory-like domain-containing protein [Salinibacterium sp.]
GRVVDEQGQGLAGVRVAAMPNPQEADEDVGALARTLRAATTDRQGRFRLTDLAPVETLLSASREDRPMTMTRVQTPFPDSVDLQMIAGRRSAGSIRDATSGAPVASAVITVVAGSLTGAQLFRATSDAEGRFELRGLSDGLQKVVTVRHPDYAPWADQFGSSLHAGTDNEILLVRGLQLTATVVDPSERPVAGLSIRLKGPGSLVDATFQTDEAGQFVAPRILPGIYFVRCLDALHAFHGDDQLIRIDDDESDPTRCLRLQPSLQIQGRTRRADGKAIAGIEVEFIDEDDALLGGVHRTTSGPDGGFRIGGLPRSEGLWMRISDPAYARMARWLCLPAGIDLHDLGDILLEPAAAFEGRVIDARKSAIA